MPVTHLCIQEVHGVMTDAIPGATYHDSTIGATFICNGVVKRSGDDSDDLELYVVAEYEGIDDTVYIKKQHFDEDSSITVEAVPGEK